MILENTSLEKIHSDTVDCIGYNHEKKIVYVCFKKNNRKYKYFNVPLNVYLKVLNGEHMANDGHYPSVGSALHHYIIKGNYRQQEI